jgi:redox-sensitive bicupin YhaK (pirin superfamily)
LQKPLARAIRAPKYAKSPLDILLIGGTPLNEPVARYSPFVMNTKEEILQAVEDYRNGKMGEIRRFLPSCEPFHPSH